MTYTVSGLDPAQFSHLYGLSDKELESQGARRRIVGEDDTVPERIELRDAPAGSTVLLVNHTHLPAANPYRSSYAVFVREGATEAAMVRDAVPEMLAKRQISLRGFDEHNMLAAFDVVQGSELEPVIVDFLARPGIAYLHAHYAGPGCYAALIRRG